MQRFLLSLIVVSVFYINNSASHDIAKSNYDNKKLVKILSVGGGGMYGVIHGKILKAIEDKLEKPIAQSFDVICGISSGSIIGLLLNISDDERKPIYRAGDVVNFYKEHGKTIFENSFRSNIICRPFGAKYSGTGKTHIAKEIFQNRKMSDVITPHLVVPSLNIATNDLFFFVNGKKNMNISHDFLMRDVVNASTAAAPLYFPPVNIKYSCGGEQYAHDFIDAGILFANPVYYCLMKALYHYNFAQHKFFVLEINVYNGDTDQQKNFRAGIFSWISKIFPFIGSHASKNMSLNTDIVVNEMLGYDDNIHMSIDITLPDKYYYDMDDTSHISDLEAIANSAIMQHGDKIEQIVKIIQSSY